MAHIKTEVPERTQAEYGSNAGHRESPVNENIKALHGNLINPYPSPTIR
jgi:hypothetical protein